MNEKFIPRKRAFAIIIAALFCASSAAAEWRSDYGGIVALSGDDKVTFSCMPENSAVSGSTFRIYLPTSVPILENPTLSFEFDDGEIFEWDSNYGGDLYVGPIYGVGDNAEKILGHEAAIRFGSHRAAVGSWVAIAERFMKNSSVTISVNGVMTAPISLKGSSKALQNIAYLKSPCKKP